MSRAGSAWLVTGGKTTPTRARPAVVGLMTDGSPIFRTLAGEPYRVKGVSSFREPQIFADGGDLAPRSKAYAGFNTKRAWLYAETGALGSYAFDLSDNWPVIRDYITATNRDGFRVALTLLTSARPDAQRIVDRAFDELADFWETILIELMNEPDVYDKHTDGLIVAANTKILWTSGDYVNPEKMRGRYGVDHSPRDREMPKHVHRLKEFYEGGGPNRREDPAHHFPILEDEPPKYTDVPQDTIDPDFLAYYGGCGMFGGGATVHTETGKLGLLPTAREEALIAIALRGLDAFPADTPLGAYRIIDEAGENTLRTYVKGERAMVRSRPVTPDAPEPGWRALEPSGVLWAR